jgi:hypothetical protein
MDTDPRASPPPIISINQPIQITHRANHRPGAALLRDGQVHPIGEDRILSTAVVFDAVEGAPLVLGKRHDDLPHVHHRAPSTGLAAR